MFSFYMKIPFFLLYCSSSIFFFKKTQQKSNQIFLAVREGSLKSLETLGNVSIGSIPYRDPLTQSSEIGLSDYFGEE